VVKVLSEKENTSNNANRHATWLELFYDLVFVVVIFQLAHNLEEDFSLNGFLFFSTFRSCVVVMDWCCLLCN
jgi:low temperature requirement protein LtrA